MTILDQLIDALLEDTIAEKVGTRHEDARVRYSLPGSTVSDWPAFLRAITGYYQYHYAACVDSGTRLDEVEAQGRAKNIIENAYRREGGIAGAFAEARTGTNNGLRGVIDALAEGIKQESVMNYVRYQFDQRVGPQDFEVKVEIIREFMGRFGHVLGGHLRYQRPEAYARDYEDLIMAYVNGLRETSAIFRRL